MMVIDGLYKEYLKVLKDLVAFKSISTDPAYKKDIQKTVDYLAKYLTGFADTVRVLQGEHTNPVIYAYVQANAGARGGEKNKAQSAKTVLVYGHYDVQPAPKQGWFAPPFELYEKDNRLYARGVVDNKGQILVHLQVVKALKEQGKLAHNVIFLIEGDEETGNDELIDIVKLKVDRQFDHILVSDGQLVLDYPTIEYSLRGGFNMQVELTTAAKTVHSGIYGGFLPNAATELIKILEALLAHKLVQERKINNKLQQVLERFINFRQIFKTKHDYSKDAEFLRKNARGARLVLTQTLDELGAKAYVVDFHAEKQALDMFTQTGLTPTIEITGLEAGYTGQGFSNIIPHKASVKLNVRTAPGQNAQEIARMLEQKLTQLAPKWAQLQVRTYHVHEATIFQLPKTIETRLVDLMSQVYKKDVVWRPVGGAIPFITQIYETTKIPPIMVPFANQDCNMHGINENFRIDLIKKALEFAHGFWQGQVLG